MTAEDYALPKVDRWYSELLIALAATVNSGYES
jgi:hypothetical protein